MYRCIANGCTYTYVCLAKSCGCTHMYSQWVYVQMYEYTANSCAYIYVCIDNGCTYTYMQIGFIRDIIILKRHIIQIFSIQHGNQLQREFVRKSYLFIEH